MQGPLSNVPESTESGRFEIRGFAGSLDSFSLRMSSSVSYFFLLPDEAERVRRPPDLIRILSGN